MNLNPHQTERGLGGKMHGYTLAKAGDPIRLKLQLEGGETNKFPRAFLYKSDGTLLSGSPVALTHEADGRYVNAELTMPDIPEVRVCYKVYNDSGFSSLSSDYHFSFDVFQLNSTYDTLASLVTPPVLEVEIADLDEIETEIEEC